MLRWTLPSRNSAFWLDRNLAILASVRGGWAAHLGNVGYLELFVRLIRQLRPKLKYARINLSCPHR